MDYGTEWTVDDADFLRNVKITQRVGKTSFSKYYEKSSDYIGPAFKECKVQILNFQLKTGFKVNKQDLGLEHVYLVENNRTVSSYYLVVTV